MNDGFLDQSLLMDPLNYYFFQLVFNSQFTKDCVVYATLSDGTY